MMSRAWPTLNVNETLVGFSFRQLPKSRLWNGRQIQHPTASDGEEGFLPTVLSGGFWLTESLPFAQSAGRQTKEFEFKKLLESGKSDTLRRPVVDRGRLWCRKPAWL